MKDLMNNPGNEAERQWWVIEFEYTPHKNVWITGSHDEHDCPECQRVLQRRRIKSDKLKGTAHDNHSD